MIDARFFITVFDGASEMEVIPVNLFECNNEPYPAPGELVPFTVSRINKGVKIRFFCSGCQKGHMFYYKLGSLNEKGGKFIVCPDCRLDLAFLGSQEDVVEVASRHKREVEGLIKDMGFENFFKDPFVIYETINHIHDLAENKMLGCGCQSHDIFADLDYDNIVISCRTCGNSAIISAGCRDDLKALKQRGYLEIGSPSKLRKY